MTKVQLNKNCRVSILSTELKMVIDYFLPRILIYIQCYHN